MNNSTKHNVKLSIEAKLRAVEDACQVSKVDNTQIDPDLMMVHIEEVREVLISIGVLGQDEANTNVETEQSLIQNT